MLGEEASALLKGWSSSFISVFNVGRFVCLINQEKVDLSGGGAGSLIWFGEEFGLI